MSLRSRAACGCPYQLSFPQEITLISGRRKSRNSCGVEYFDPWCATFRISALYPTFLRHSTILSSPAFCTSPVIRQSKPPHRSANVIHCPFSSTGTVSTLTSGPSISKCTVRFPSGFPFLVPSDAIASDFPLLIAPDANVSAFPLLIPSNANASPFSTYKIFTPASPANSSICL